jgi:hypothetical protein
MRKRIIEIATWLLFETLLNLAGLDDLGNYSEFVFTQKNINIFQAHAISAIV